MAGVDTNVLIRWLMDDDAGQVACVRKAFSAALERSESLFVSSTVVLELEWVLRSRYGLDKAHVLSAFNALLETQELVFQSENALEQALHFYRSTSAGFADCLHVGICAEAGQLPMLTFDLKAAKIPGARSLRG